MFLQVHALVRLGCAALLLLTLAYAKSLDPRQSSCKAVHASSSWPSAQIWTSFNQSIGGKLLAPQPLAVVCDPSKPRYSQSQCSALASRWLQPDTHAADPMSIMSPNFQNDDCTPFENTCLTAALPGYVVDGTSADVISKALKFVNQNNVRLTVKNTGHDYLGRSSAQGLSIWTHHITGVTFNPFFLPQGGHEFVSAVTCGAGVRFKDLYSAAADRGLIVVGGGDPSVGLAGWLTGGGHSPMSPKYGLGADNTLQFEVVIPSGETVTANRYQNADLFWALNGGGGSTFGVITSFTLKTHPTIFGSAFNFEFQSLPDEASKNNNENFFNAVADLHGQFGAYSDAYGGGYTTWAASSYLENAQKSVLPKFTDPTKGVTTHQPMTFLWTGFLLGNNPIADYQNIVVPLYNKIHSTPGLNATIQVQHGVSMSLLLRFVGGVKSSGINLLMGSRLLPKESLQNRAGILKFLRQTEGLFAQSLLTSGPAVRSGDAAITSVTPAWRKAYAHTIVTQDWQWRSPTQQSYVSDQITNTYTQTLRDIAPDSGAYINEANPHEPNYQQAFWGSNYARLAQIKKKYDPNGVFYCGFCVGAEDWVEMDDGRVCRR